VWKIFTISRFLDSQLILKKRGINFQNKNASFIFIMNFESLGELFGETCVNKSLSAQTLSFEEILVGESLPKSRRYCMIDMHKNTGRKILPVVHNPNWSVLLHKLNLLFGIACLSSIDFFDNVFINFNLTVLFHSTANTTEIFGKHLAAFLHLHLRN